MIIRSINFIYRQYFIRGNLERKRFKIKKKSPFKNHKMMIFLYFFLYFVTHSRERERANEVDDKNNDLYHYKEIFLSIILFPSARTVGCWQRLVVKIFVFFFMMSHRWFFVGMEIREKKAASRKNFN